MELCYTTSFGGAPVEEGDTIPASQTTILKKDVVIVQIASDRKEIWGKVEGVVGQVCFPAEELGLRWKATEKTSMRKRADAIKAFRCRHLIAVLENPSDIMNVASVIRNVNALGVEKIYIVDPGKHIPENWHELRERRKLSKLSVSSSRWTFVRRFDTTDECFDYLESKGYQSIVTSPHVKGKESLYLHEGDYTAPKLAVWFGNEGKGISDRAVERAKACVAIPMFGMIESLNLGTSSGIILYEVARQRREYQSKYRRARKRGKRSEPLPTVMTPEPSRP